MTAHINAQSMTSFWHRTPALYVIVTAKQYLFGEVSSRFFETLTPLWRSQSRSRYDFQNLSDLMSK